MYNPELLKTKPMLTYDCDGDYCENQIDALHGSAYLREGKFYCGKCFNKLPGWMKYPDYFSAPSQPKLCSE